MRSIDPGLARLVPDIVTLRGIALQRHGSSGYLQWNVRDVGRGIPRIRCLTVALEAGANASRSPQPLRPPDRSAASRVSTGASLAATISARGASTKCRSPQTPRSSAPPLSGRLVVAPPDGHAILLESGGLNLALASEERLGLCAKPQHQGDRQGGHDRSEYVPRNVVRGLGRGETD